jgi:hypothetical protein
MRPISAVGLSTLLTGLLCICASRPAMSQSNDSTRAKNLYMVQKPIDNWGDIQLGYGYGFLNPYENLHHFVLKANYRFHPNWQAGIQGSYIKAIKNEATRVLEASLGGVNIKTEFQNPQYSLHATVGMIPLSGLLNFFSTSVVPFDLVVGLKAGITNYERSGMAPSFGPLIEYKTYFFHSLGLYFGLEYAFEHIPEVNNQPAVWVSQSHVGVGLTWAF